VLAGTFAVFAVVGARSSGGSQIVNVGVGLAVGVIMDTFVVRTVLVPCTVVLLGRWNWWPSKITVTPSPEETDSVGASADALGLAGPEATTDPATNNESRRNS
jgi:RND superfamily putative drug exporter